MPLDLALPYQNKFFQWCKVWWRFRNPYTFEGVSFEVQQTHSPHPLLFHHPSTFPYWDKVLWETFHISKLVWWHQGGMLTWTFRKVSKISLLSSFLDLENQLRNGKDGTIGCSLVLRIFLGGSPISIWGFASSSSPERSLFALSSSFSLATFFCTS